MERHVLVALGVACSLLAAPAAHAQSPSPTTRPSTGQPSPAVRAALPAPTGRLPVGFAALHLVDRSRPDPWVPEFGDRQLPVSVWYPAAASSGAAAPYLTAAESAAVLAPYEQVPPDALAATRTHARAGAAPVTVKRGLPLVLMSPGHAFPRATMTSLGEELASRGYLVAAVEHTHESVATTLPDGRTVGCVTCRTKMTREWGATITASRVRDMRFVLDELLRGRWGRLVDRSRIGMAGFSLGGNTVSQVMAADRRVRAGVNLDGTVMPEVPAEPVRRPYLMVGTERNHTPAGDGSWKTFWPHVKGWKRWLTVAGTDHAAFTDYAVLRRQLGIPAQELDGGRATAITRTYVRSFFDRHLLRERRPLLDGPSPAYPEVRFWRG
ncbi:alpha/beta hydrolase family protein [Nonomuraea sp. NPDC047897]|uniref:alpha/beta hydrolase family protein n=1 Tax=Nonomuraea sp. NPDC047897 TaxID=3364346 RepID=UPI003715938C